MADTIDSISIELTASTQKAENSIQRVIDMLSMLKAAAIDASVEAGINKTIRSIAKAAKEVDTDAGQRLARLAGGLNALSKVGDLSNLSTAGKNLASIIKAVSNVGKSSGVGSLAREIRDVGEALNGISDSDAERLRVVSDSLTGEMSGPIHTSNIGYESAELGGGNGNTPALQDGGMLSMADNISYAERAFRAFTMTLGGVNKLLSEFVNVAHESANAMARLGNTGWTWGNKGFNWASAWAKSRAQQLSGSQRLLGDAPNFMTGNGIDKSQAIEIEDLGETAVSAAAGFERLSEAERFANFRMKPLEDEAASTSARLRQIGDEAGRSGGFLETIKNGASAVTSHMRSDARGIAAFGGSLKNIGSFGAKAIGVISHIPRVIGGQFIGSLKESVKNFGHFFSSIKRIAMYRAIRSALKFITESFGEGMKNLYAWSNTADKAFSSAMDRLATAKQYAGNSIAAMVSPLIEAFAPAIDFIVDKFVDLFNIVNQIFARLTGQSTYTAAKKVAAVWDDSAKKASGSAKKAADEIKRTILGFDEINKLNGANERSSGGGSGSSTAAANASNMFEKRNIEGSVSSFADSLKAAFTSGEWNNLGKLLGDKVNSIINSVDFGGIGAKVGTYINGWFSTKYWTLDTINFTNIGSKIADFLNNAISKIDFGIIGRTLVQRLTIVGDTLIGFFTDFDFGKAASSISDFVKGIYNEITKWFDKYDWTTVGQSIADGLVDFIANIDYVGIAKSFITALNTALESSVTLLAGFFDTLADRFKAAINWDELPTSVQTAITAVMAILGGAALAIGAVLAFSGANIPLGIGLIIAGATALGTAASLKWDLSNIVKKHLDVVMLAVSAAGLAIGAVLAFSGANIPLGIGIMLASAATLGSEVAVNWNTLKEKLQGPIGKATAIISGASLVLGILALCGGMIPLGIGLILAGAAGLAATVAANWDNLKDLGVKAIQSVKKGWDSIKLVLKAAVELVKKGWTTLTKWVGDIAAKGVKLVKNGWKSLTSWVGDISAKGVKLVKNGWITLTAWVGNIADKGVKLVKNGWTTLTAWVGNIADKGVKLVKNGWTTITAWVGNIADKGVKLVKNGWTTITAWVGNIADKGVKLVKNGWTTITAWVGNIADKGVKLIRDGWTTITAWVGNIGDKGVKLVKNGWTTITAWVGNIADKGVKLVRNGWTTITAWVGNIADKGVKLVRSGWTTITSWVGEIGARSVSLIRSGWTTLADWAKSFGGSVFELFIKPVWDSPLLNYLLGQNAPSDRSKIISEDAGALAYAQQSALKNNIVITADLEQGWFGTPESALGIDNLYTDADVGLERAWYGDAITALGLNNLRTVATVDVVANVTSLDSIIAPATNFSGTYQTRKAFGGIFSANRWTDIPQYAGGTLNAHGSLFLAGEAGPEIVGHVGGRTEVLNKSQIAAAMYSAVQAAMAPATATMAYAAQSMGANSDGIDGEALASMIQQAVENAMSRSNDIARQGNEYLRQISDKDFSAEITTSSMNKAQTRMNRRAGVTLVPVGT